MALLRSDLVVGDKNVAAPWSSRYYAAPAPILSSSEGSIAASPW